MRSMSYYLYITKAYGRICTEQQEQAIQMMIATNKAKEDKAELSGIVCAVVVG